MTTQPIEYQDDFEKSPLLKPMTSTEIAQLMTLLSKWEADESGYEEEAWSDLIQALDQERDRLSARRLFS
jgi:hypothetical protein